LNLYRDNPDLRHHVERGIGWEAFVPHWERGFGSEDGPEDVAQARELYAASLDEIGGFCAREIAPRAGEVDAAGVAVADGRVRLAEPLERSVSGLARMGALGLSLPRERGGLNFPYSVSAAALELVGTACTNTLLRSAFYQSPALLLERFGSEQQKQRWVPELAAGRVCGCIAITEPDAGSDVGRIATRAEAEGGSWRVSGRKQFITNGDADLCVALVRTEPGSTGLRGLSMLLVPREREDGGGAAYAVAPPEQKQVIRASPTCELSFDGAPAELLGERGAGFRQMLSFMNEARLAVGVQGLGLGQAALDAASRYAAQRQQMGRPIARHPMVAARLLDMRDEIAALRALVYRCSELGDRIEGLERAGGSLRERAALTRALRERTPLLKWFGSERALWLTRSAVQIHGGYGVMPAYGVERLYRDALILPIYEGTSQIQALMSLRDQVASVASRPWRLLGGPARVEAPGDTLGDALREMAGEYNRSLRSAVESSPGWGRLLVAAVRGAGRPGTDGLTLVAERLLAMLAWTRAAEALVASAGDAERRRVAERFVHRALPRVRYEGELARCPDPEALAAAADPLPVGAGAAS